LLLQALYTVRSKRQSMEQLDYNLLHWFVGLSADVWNATVFCKTRDPLVSGDVAVRSFGKLLSLPQVKAYFPTNTYQSAAH